MTARLERELAAREQLVRTFDKLCPHVVGNPWIPHWPTPPQQAFLGLHVAAQATKENSGRVFQALYGGAAGGGKSNALLSAAAQYAWKNEDFAGIIFRRTFTDLTQPGAILDRAMQWWIPAGARWDGTTKAFHFPGGGRVVFAYLFRPNDHLNYQGAEYHFTAWDELTQWPTSAPYDYVGLSRVRRRKDCPIPLRTLAASNPGGPGHAWVQRKFVGGVDPESGLAIDPEHPYVPAKIQDNPHLDQDAYIEGLMHMHPTVRAQLLNGDWSARDPGDYFRAEWFGPLLDPAADLWPSSECIRIRWWDLAGSEKADSARTSGVRMARHRSGVRAIEHCRSFRATPGKRDDLICQTAQADGHSVVVGIEIEGGSGGLAQFHVLERRLRDLGYRVTGARPRAEQTTRESRLVLRGSSSQPAKEARADPVASCLERGYQRRGEGPNTGAPWWGDDEGKGLCDQKDGIRLFSGPWTADYLDVVEGFPEGPTCDEVDATTGAWAWLEAHPMGSKLPQLMDTLPERAELQNVHPADRPEPRPLRFRP